MYLFITDETNVEPTVEGKFFIFGGIIVKTSRASDLDVEVRDIKEKAGYKNEDLFKFDTRLRPKYVTKTDFDKAKNGTLDVCVKNEVTFVAYLIHHNIIKKEIKIESAINHLTSGFNKFLEEKNSFGICIYDRIPNINNQFSLLKENFSKGLKLQNNKLVKLDRIKMHAVSCAGASNLSSLTDIVLGSFRYCVNNPKNETVAKSMIKKISDMVWGEKKNNHIYCINKGIILRPYKPVQMYKKDYDELIVNINNLLSDNSK